MVTDKIMSKLQPADQAVAKCGQDCTQQYLAYMQIHRNSYLLVNDMRHQRHQKVSLAKNKKIPESAWNISLNDIFNP